MKKHFCVLIISFSMVSLFSLCFGEENSESKKENNSSDIKESETGIDNQKRIEAKDTSGKKWVLHDWTEGSRPYKKDLIKREAIYKEKWGEHWAGESHSIRGRVVVVASPGKWEYDVISLKGFRLKYMYPKFKAGKVLPGKSQALVYAPGGSEKISDVYLVGGQSLIHMDPVSHATTIIGAKATDFPHKQIGKERRIPTLGPEAVIDGLESEGQLQPTKNPYGNWLTCDPITGRVYFVQRTGGRGSPTYLRYVEKLLLYKVGETELLLPAFLDWDELYKKVGAVPVRVKGKRVKARFAIRTTPIKDFRFVGAGKAWGRKVLLSLDGKSVWKGHKLAKAGLYEIDTGRKVVDLKMAFLPKGAFADRHEAVCGGRFDNDLYFCRHTGCGNGQGRMFSVATATGKVTMLYDSLSVWPWKDCKSRDQKRLQRTLGVGENGPADAVTLSFGTTCFFFQCPRTGSLTSGGWDGVGFRRYHDGFVTALAMYRYARPEWKGHLVAGLGDLQVCPDVAPNGDVWFVDVLHKDYRAIRSDDKDRNLLGTKEDLRIVHFRRTDWPKEQPLNGYANKFLSPEKRKQLMIDYAKDYIANYKELSKVY